MTESRTTARNKRVRVVLTLHYIESFTIEATAAELGVAPGTVKSRLAYGLKQLRDAR